MGCFDVFSFITGISASGVPDWFIGEDEEDQEHFASRLAQKLKESRNPELPPEDEVKTIILKVLKFVQCEVEDQVKIPGSWHDAVLAIGDLDEDGGDDSKISSCVCRSYDSYGSFDEVREDDGTWTNESVNISDGAIFMDLRCWYYVQAWLHQPSGSSKSWEQELWDLFGEDMNDAHLGIANSLDYGMMCFTWGQFQDGFLDNCEIDDALDVICEKNVPNLAKAISQGVRGKDLVPALFTDLKLWMFQSPDIWPEPSKEVMEKILFQPFRDGRPHRFIDLPLELLVHICSSLSLMDILNLSSTSKGMRKHITGSTTLSIILQQLINTGTLLWMKPCSLVDGEVENANKALSTWLPEVSNNCDPLASSKFPFLPFVYTCITSSDSMKSRHRVWSILKEVEVLLTGEDDEDEGDEDEDGEDKGEGDESDGDSAQEDD